MNRLFHCAAIVSRPEYVHARFGMEFWPLDADKTAFPHRRADSGGGRGLRLASGFTRHAARSAGNHSLFECALHGRPLPRVCT